MRTKLKQYQVEVQDTHGINMIGGTTDLPLQVYSPGLVKRDCILVSVSLNSYSSTGTAVTASISVLIKQNGTTIGTVSLSSASSVNDTSLAGFSFTKGSTLTYEVTSNSGVKNLLLTIFVN